MRTGFVFYCDGGANPNPGPCASGVHGYSYTPLEEGEKPTKCDSWFATDQGYVTKKDYDSGLFKGVKIVEIIEMIDAIGTGTNNIAEVNAVAVAFEKALTYQDIIAIHIICDSQYALTGMNEYLPGWIRNNWILSTGSTVKNVDLWKKIAGLKDIVTSKTTLTTKRINGHEGDFGNTKADYLATIGVTRCWRQRLGRNDYSYAPESYFEKIEAIHPFISLNRVFFNTDAEFYQPGMYYQSDGSGKEFVTGKRASESAFSVVFLQEPDWVVDTAIRAVHELKADYNRVVYGKVDAFKGQDFLLFLKNYGTYSLIPDRRNLNLNSLERKPVVAEVRADELPLRAFDCMGTLESVLVEFQNNYLENGSFFNGDTRKFTIKDVTEHFYLPMTKKSGKNEIHYYELKKDFPVGCTNTKIDLEYPESKTGSITAILSFGEDIPPRNSFRKFEMLEPSVFIVTWKDSDHLVRYATIVKTDDAVGIWCNYFANNVLLKK